MRSGENRFVCVGERGVSHPPSRKLARQLDHLAHPLPRALRPGPLRHELLHLKVRKWALDPHLWTPHLFTLKTPVPTPTSVVGVAPRVDIVPRAQRISEPRAGATELRDSRAACVDSTSRLYIVLGTLWPHAL